MSAEGEHQIAKIHRIAETGTLVTLRVPFKYRLNLLDSGCVGDFPSDISAKVRIVGPDYVYFHTTDDPANAAMDEVSPGGFTVVLGDQK